MNGEILKSFIHTHQYGMTFGKSIMMSGDHNVYINIPYSNQIYEWRNEYLYGYCYTDFGKFNIPIIICSVNQKSFKYIVVSFKSCICHNHISKLFICQYHITNIVENNSSFLKDKKTPKAALGG